MSHVLTQAFKQEAIPKLPCASVLNKSLSKNDFDLHKTKPMIWQSQKIVSTVVHALQQ